MSCICSESYIVVDNMSACYACALLDYAFTIISKLGDIVLSGLLQHDAQKCYLRIKVLRLKTCHALKSEQCLPALLHDPRESWFFVCKIRENLYIVQNNSYQTKAIRSIEA